MTEETGNVSGWYSRPIGCVEDPVTGYPHSLENRQLYTSHSELGNSYYLPLEHLPKEMLNTGNPYTIMSDSVDEKPMIPVSVERLPSKAVIVRLEPEAFLLNQEINAGYQVLAKAAVGPVEYALAENPKTHFFATWERTPANDKAGEPNYYWGHYHEDRDKALADFSSRVREKCAELAEDRKPSIRKLLAAKPPARPAPAAKARVQEAAL